MRDNCTEAEAGDEEATEGSRPPTACRREPGELDDEEPDKGKGGLKANRGAGGAPNEVDVSSP